MHSASARASSLVGRGCRERIDAHLHESIEDCVLTFRRGGMKHTFHMPLSNIRTTLVQDHSKDDYEDELAQAVALHTAPTSVFAL